MKELKVSEIAKIAGWKNLKAMAKKAKKTTGTLRYYYKHNKALFEAALNADKE